MTTDSKKRVYRIVLGFIGSTLAGGFFFGNRVFVISSPFFQFLTGGLLAAVFFALLRSNKKKDAVFAGLLIFVLSFFISGSNYFLSHLLYFLGIGAAVFIYAEWLFEKFNQKKVVRSLGLVVLFTVIFIMVNLILTFIYYSADKPVLPFRTAPVGAIMGIGLAIGFETAEWLGKED